MSSQASPAKFPAWKIRNIVLFALPFVVTAVGIGVWFVSASDYPPLDARELFAASLKFSAPALVVFLWFAAQGLKGRSSSHRELGFLLAISLFGFSLCAYATLAVLNARLDQGDSSTHTVLVLRKYTAKAKTSSRIRHYIRTAWEGVEKPQNFRVSQILFDKIAPNRSYVEVVTRPGAFGHTWLVSDPVLTTAPADPRDF